MHKHAYLLCAFNNWNILKTIIELLDDDENDIYLHVNKTVKDYNQSEFENITSRSKLIFLERVDTGWGNYGLTQVLINFLMIASKEKYFYYHFCSGTDMPLKSQAEIHSFFEKYGKGKVNFIDSQPIDAIINNTKLDWIKYYYFGVKYSRHKYIRPLYRIFNQSNVLVQKLFRIDRIKHLNCVPCSGSEWFSITDEFANYIINNQEWIKNHFNHTFIPGEAAIHTLIWASSYRDTIVNAEINGYKDKTMRLISFSRGRVRRGEPYMWQAKDFNELINSNMLFARKFDEVIDMEVVNKLKEYILNSAKNSNKGD